MYNNGRRLIGVFLNNISTSFHSEVCYTLSKLATEHDIDIAIFNTFANEKSNDRYEFLESRLLNIAPIERMDGIIILADTYGIKPLRIEVLEILKARKRPDCPLINLRSAADECEQVFGRGNYYQISIKEEHPYEMLVEHAIVQHDSRNICYMAGPKGHQDAERRLACFKRVLERHGLSLHDNALFYGDFWHNMTGAALDQFYSDPTWKPDAIICGNDFMAIDIDIELMRRGIVVPNDVIVIGFDDLPEASCCYPSLTTMGVNLASMATVAFNTMLRHWNGECEYGIVWMEPQLKKRASCGCFPIDSPELRLLRNTLINKNNGLYLQQLSLAYSYMNTGACNSLDELMSNVLSKVVQLDGYRDFYFCLCTDDGSDDIVSTKYIDDITDDIIVSLAVKDTVVADYHSRPVEERLITRSQLLPPMAERDEATCYYYTTVHSRDCCYGYTVCSFYDHKQYDFQYYCWLISLSVGITEMLNRLRLNSALRLNEQLSVTDPLTGLLNRRGFEEYSAKLFDSRRDNVDCICMISADLDGLKQINDKFGHAEGDFAIRAVGLAIKRVLGGRGIVARMGGDEYVAMYLTEASAKLDFEQALRFELEKVNAEAHKPYRISASVGSYCAVIDSNDSIEELLRRSDEKLYEAKRLLRRRNSDRRLPPANESSDE